ncbi:MAG TPA: aromatic ring-hydroxylating dioxygenase subunit alpha [Pseudomonadales bacterium]|nr:aromatic ring-hydroxylating dioxygenase subunit alpha [Pseudomonadales bacterium]
MRERLIEITREIVAHGKAGTIPQTPDIMRVPAEHYCDEARFALEMKQVFKRVPLMLAMTAELPNVGDYKAMEVVGTPLLIARGDDGRVRTFVNMCSHRGSQLMPVGRGSAKRFTCPYHAWSYSTDGQLTGVFREREFGDVDRSCNGLTALPTTERAGLIWVTLNPKSTLDMDAFLAGYDEALGHFGFENWYFFANRTLEGPNWKIAYDGYMDFYHLPILHKNSFGPDMFSQAMYHAWGPHQRVSTPNAALADVPESEWTDEALMRGVWTIFPHISIAEFNGGGRGVMISQLFPGETVSRSYTIQNYLMEKKPADEIVPQATEQFAFLERVVRDEDYATGIKQQRALSTGAKSHVMFGRNEAGGQLFHNFLAELLTVDDDKLDRFFAMHAQSNGAPSAPVRAPRPANHTAKVRVAAAKAANGTTRLRGGAKKRNGTKASKARARGAR